MMTNCVSLIHVDTSHHLTGLKAGMDGEAIFVTGRGGAGRGLAKNVWGGAGGGTPPFPTVRGRAGKGSKSAGQGGARAGNN